ncbi:hypothetical protein [Nocardia sp. NPDC049526]|uniref:hypothetical protein n=1 Tax=Nocardia sp. NPDC049526 TaxID=3364316 RepID=UPI00378AC6BC
MRRRAVTRGTLAAHRRDRGGPQRHHRTRPFDLDAHDTTTIDIGYIEKVTTK